MKKKRNKRVRLRKRAYVVLVLFIGLIIGSISLFGHLIEDQNAKPIAFIPSDKQDYIYLSLKDNLYSPIVYLYDVQAKKTLYQQRAEEKTYPASLTKMMTVLIACEYYQDYDQKVTIQKEIFPYLWETHLSVANFEAYEEVTINDLLYGALLSSGADATITLANEIAGSEEAFAELMNAKVKEWGLTQTSFVNSTGMDADNFFSTASDMAVIVEEAYKNKKFKEVFTAYTYTTSKNSFHPEGIELKSFPYSYLQSSDGSYRFIGSKTGYTDLAMQCLASMVMVDDKEYILVTMQADGEYNKDEHFSFDDAKYVYELLGKLYHKKE